MIGIIRGFWDCYITVMLVLCRLEIRTTMSLGDLALKTIRDHYDY